MQVFHSLQDYQNSFSQCVATVGKYDGMHIGHQAILTCLQAQARRLQLPSVVILSEPHPEEFFLGDAAPPRLNDFQDKVAFLETFGIDVVYCMRFNEALSRMLPEDFMRQVLIDGLGIRSLVVGDDFNFGRDRQGNVALLQAYGEKYDFVVHEVTGCQLAEERVSSTRIREALVAGDCARAERLLGRPYSLYGKVVAGQKLGRELGFPTANIELADRRLALSGVFAVRAQVDGVLRPAVANLGRRPTVTDDTRLVLEVHLLDDEAELYGKEMQVEFLQRLRPEQKFESLEALRARIECDVAAAREFFAAQ